MKTEWASIRVWKNPITEVKQHKSMLVLGWVTAGIFLLNLEVTICIYAYYKNEVATAKTVQRGIFCELLAGYRPATLASIWHMLECLFAHKLLNTKLRSGIHLPALKISRSYNEKWDS